MTPFIYRDPFTAHEVAPELSADEQATVERFGIHDGDVRNIPATCFICDPSNPAANPEGCEHCERELTDHVRQLVCGSCGQSLGQCAQRNVRHNDNCCERCTHPSDSDAWETVLA